MDTSFKSEHQHDHLLEWALSQVNHIETADTACLEVNRSENEVPQSVTEIFLNTSLVQFLFKCINQSFFSRTIEMISRAKQSPQSLLKGQKSAVPLQALSRVIDQYLVTAFNKKLSKTYIQENFQRKASSTEWSLHAQQEPLEETSFRYSIKSGSQSHSDQPQLQSRNEQQDSIESEKADCFNKTQQTSFFEEHQSRTSESFVSVLDSRCKIATSADQTEQSLREIIKLQFYLILQSQKHQQANKCSLKSNKEYEQLEKQQHQNRTSLISRVCALSEECQDYLMSEIRSIEQKKLESDFRELLSKIEELEDENEGYKEKINAILLQNEQLEETLQECIKEEQTMNSVLERYEQQKKDLFRTMNEENSSKLTMASIQALEEFVEVYKIMENDNLELQDAISDLQSRNFQLQRENAECVFEINKQAKQITKINEQIADYKQKISNLENNIELYDDGEDSGNEGKSSQEEADTNSSKKQKVRIESMTKKTEETLIPLNILSERKDFNNNTGNNSNYNPLQSSRSHLSSNHTNSKKSSFRSQQRQGKSLKSKHQRFGTSEAAYLQGDKQNNEQDLKECDQILRPTNENQKAREQVYEEQEISQGKRKYRLELMNRLELLYKEISEVTNQVSSLKQENAQLRKKNIFNAKKLSNLKVVHEAFRKELEYMQN